MSKTVVGLLDDRDEAESVVTELVDSGFDRSDISLVASDTRGAYVSQTGAGETASGAGSGALAGAGAGAAFGGIGGLLVGLAGLAIPGIGPIIAAGPIAAALAGAGVGAVAGGLIGALTDLGVPDEHVEYYAEGVRRGGVLVAVRTDEDRADIAANVLRNHSAVDIDERARGWREQGWTRFDETGSAYSDDEIETERANVRTVGAERRASEDEVARATDRNYIGRGEMQGEQTAQPHLQATPEERTRGTESPHDFNYRGEAPAEATTRAREGSFDLRAQGTDRPLGLGEGAVPDRDAASMEASGPLTPEPIGSGTRSDKTIRDRDVDRSIDQPLDERISQQSSSRDDRTIGEKLRDTGRELGEELGIGSMSGRSKYTGVERRRNTGAVYTGVERRAA
jgi:hypothetical protein